jgi:hypothetical protein
MTSVDLFVGNNTLIDPELYSLWLNGYSGSSSASSWFMLANVIIELNRAHVTDHNFTDSTHSTHSHTALTVTVSHLC